MTMLRTMVRATLRTVLWAAVLAAVALPAQAGTPEYQVDVFILAIPDGEDLSYEADRAEFHDQEQQLGFAARVSSLSLAGIDINCSETGRLLFNGEEELPAGSPIELLTTRRIIAAEGQNVQVRVDTNLQYFRRYEDDLFRLEYCGPEDSPGLQLDLKVYPRPDAEDDILPLKINFRVAVMTGREELPGVELDVGRPILKVLEAGFGAALPLDTMNLVTLPVEPPQDAKNDPGELLLVLLKARASRG